MANYFCTMNQKQQQTNLKFIRKISGYSFLFFTILQALLILLESLGIDKLGGGNSTMLAAIGAGISGFLFVWTHQKSIEKQSIRNWQKEKKKEKESLQRFHTTYPRLSKIPLIGFLVRKWQEEPLVYKLAIIGLCVFGAIIYTHKLTHYDWLPDEPLVIGAAKGYVETGTYNKWDFWLDQAGTDADKYDRAWPHTWLVAQSIRFFGLSEFTTRMVSVLFGLIFILVIYGVSVFFIRDRNAALLITLACMLHPYFVVYFRRVRMYALFAPLFVLLFYTAYRILSTKKYAPRLLYERNPWMQTYFNYDWMLVVGMLVLLYFTVELQRLAFLIFPVVLPTYLYLLVVKKQKRLLLPLMVLGIVFLAFGMDILKKNTRSIVFFEVHHWAYFDYFLDFVFSKYFSGAVLIIGSLFIWYEKNTTKILSLYFLVATSLLLYVYMIDFFVHFRYAIHLLPLSYILLMGLLLKINQLYSEKWQKAIIPSLIVVLSIGNFIGQYEWIYDNYPEAQFSSKAYATIQQNIQPQKEGLIALYLDEIYLRGMGRKVQKVELLNKKQYSIDAFKEDVKKFEEGAWVVWATHKSYHLRNDLQNHILKNCGKYHGHGIDGTKVEVYYCR